MIFTNKTGRKTVIVILFLILAIGFIGNVSAITGSLGNARMIIHAKTGEQIEKYILVKNVNNETINIEILKEGELVNDIILKENNFTLGAGEDKKAEFIIRVRKEGTFENKLNVKFSPVDKKSGVGLSSTVIVIAEKGDGTTNFTEDDSDIPGTDDSDDSGIDISDLTSKLDIKFIAIAGTIILLVIFIILYIISAKKRKVEKVKEIKEVKREEKEKGSIKPKKEIEKK